MQSQESLSLWPQDGTHQPGPSVNQWDVIMAFGAIRVIIGCQKETDKARFIVGCSGEGPEVKKGGDQRGLARNKQGKTKEKGD